MIARLRLLLLVNIRLDLAVSLMVRLHKKYASEVDASTSRRVISPPLILGVKKTIALCRVLCSAGD
jgi:hypothetical protein